ncbi:4-hydroxy-3-methylbut-2-enyl diphosphate reductase [Desulfurobacterium atlanticum]|uniref:4-hydroxy-3-methylbut-2-enyl diphosphate reductase n=1 Tax=Desulfurobacterium atlanticum TaxID=240169 RepID=A0A239ADU3_9BACT|nr:4-hydroxy-3-methylbut-2-enyl diphosphate reductase [Desulfurobacterium atlanticum]SNR93198.1 4-hydroxy-3-methylbut-2-enyl diphosphate reductase [Desulfurobacterium atlanticum]
MKIIVAKSAGFCWGVKRAVNMAIAAAKKNGTVYSLGELIHNPQEIKRLETLGIKKIDSINEIPKNSTVIIRSHGVPPDIIKKLKEKGIFIVDATCPFVKAIQEKAISLEKEGYPVCILGNSSHPEVIGIAGHVKDPVIVENENDIEKLPPFQKLGIVCQTTLNSELLSKFVASLSKEIKEMKLFNTICKATKVRQEETRKLAQQVDMMIVIGGKNSSNTGKLYAISKKLNRNSFHIESAEEIDESWFKNIEKIGITAGASTPQWIIEEVIERIKTILKGGETVERGLCKTT